MKKIIFFIFILALVLFQVTLLDYFRVFGVKPNLFLISIVIIALIFDLKWALILGISVGILKDSLGASSFGIDTLLFPLWIFLIVKLSREISLDNNPIRMLLIFVIVIFHSVLVKLISFAFDKSYITPGIFLRITFLESLYTTAVLPLVFKVTKSIFYPVEIE